MQAGTPRLQLQDPLTEKEIKDLSPRMEEAFTVFLGYVDMGISYTNKEKATAVIWQTIDEDEVKILVKVLLDGGKRSRIVATAARQVTKSYNLLQIGLITLPRFIQTFKFYQNHGGFALPLFGGGQQHEQQQPSGA